MTKEQRQYSEAKIVFSTNGTETTGHHMQRKKSTNKPHTFHKTELKKDHKLQCKMQNYKVLEGNRGEKSR